MFDGMGTSSPQIRAAASKPLAVTTLTRAPAFPDIPTLQEAGVPGIDVTTWYALWAPAGTPPEIVNKLQQEVAKALASPAQGHGRRRASGRRQHAGGVRRVRQGRDREVGEGREGRGRAHRLTRSRSGNTRRRRLPRPPVLVVEFHGVGARLGRPAPAEHTREFVDPAGAVERLALDSMTPAPSRFSTRKWWSANEATCGRCVTHSTCRCAPSDCSSRPTVAATAPPMPASTSSKTSVGTWPTSLAATWIARPMRDSSPPDATRDSGPTGCFACAAIRNSSESSPWLGRRGQRLERDFEPPAGHRERAHRRGHAMLELGSGEAALRRGAPASGGTAWPLAPRARQRLDIGGRGERRRAPPRSTPAARAALRDARDACARCRAARRGAPRCARARPDRGRAGDGSRATRAPPRRAAAARARPARRPRPAPDRAPRRPSGGRRVARRGA